MATSNFIDMTGRWKVIELDKEETEKHTFFDGKR